MHPITEELLSHIDQHRRTLAAAIDQTPIEIRERKPAPDRWSIAEVLEHLTIVEHQVARLLKRGLETASQAGPLAPAKHAGPVVPTLDATLLLDRERPRAAQRGVQPTMGLTSVQAWQQLEVTRRALRAAIVAADGLDTDAIRAPHPFLGELTFQQWVAFIGLHEARHAAQIEATCGTLLAKRD